MLGCKVCACFLSSVQNVIKRISSMQCCFKTKNKSNSTFANTESHWKQFQFYNKDLFGFFQLDRIRRRNNKASERSSTVNIHRPGHKKYLLKDLAQSVRCKHRGGFEDWSQEIMQIRATWPQQVNQSSCRQFTSVTSRIYIWQFTVVIWLLLNRHDD